MRKKTKNILRLATVLTLVIIAALVITPWFLNPDYLQSLALRQIQETFGPHVSVGHTRFALFPQPHFLVSNIAVKDTPEAHAVFRAQTVSLKLGIGQLLQKNLVVREFVLDQPEIEIHRNRSGDWIFLGHSGGSSPFLSLAKFLVLGKFVVLDGKIILIDESPQDVVQGFVLDEVICRTETQHDSSSVITNLELAGVLRQHAQPASFHVQGTFEVSLTPEPSTIREKSLPFEDFVFSGTVVANGLEPRQFSQYLPQGEWLKNISEPLKIETQVEWKQEAETFQLHFTKIALLSQALTFAGNANINGLADGHHMYGVTMRSSNVPLTIVRQYLPSSWIPAKFRESWNKGQIDGELNVEEARMTASTRPDVGRSITGIFQLNNGLVRLPDWPVTERLQGTVHVEPDRIHVVDGKGQYDGIPIRVNRGILLFKDSGPFADIEIQGPVPAKKVSEFIIDLQKSTATPGVLQSWKVLEGHGELRLGFSGHLLGDEGLRFQYGDYEFHDFTLRIPSLPHPVSQGKGKVLFSRTSTVFEGIRGGLGPYPWKLDGTVNHARGSRYEALHVSFAIDGSELFPNTLDREEGTQPWIWGPVRAKATFNGPTDRPKIKGHLDLQEAQVELPFILSKASGLPANIEIEGQMLSRTTFRFTRVEWDMLPLKLHGQGLLRKGRKWSWEGRLDSSPIYVGLLPDGLRVLGNLIESGILEIQLGGRGSGSDWRQWDLKGWVALTEGLLSIRGVTDPVTNVFLRVKIAKDLLEFKRIQFRIRDSEAALTGFVKDWSHKPAVSAMFEASQFDLDLLIPKEERSVLRDGVEWLATHGTLEGSLVVEEPRYKTLSGHKLSGTIKVHDNLVSLDKVQMLVEEDGTLGGRMFIHLPMGKPGALRASFHAEKIPFDKILSVLGDDKRFITGKADIQGMLQGHGRDVGGVTPTLNGHLTVTLRDGNVRKGKVVPKILTLLNLPSVLRGKVSFKEKGFPFKKVRTNIQIENGIFTSKDFVVNSPIVRMTAAGDYNLVKDDLDVAAAVSPFGPYSKLIQKIPLFGNIFAGERKGIATAMFSVKGNLNSPKVKYLPMESWKTRVNGLAQLAFDILKNTVTLPYELLKESQDSTVDSKETSSEPQSRTPDP